LAVILFAILYRWFYDLFERFAVKWIDPHLK
jgi:hypothetical protein